MPMFAGAALYELDNALSELLDDTSSILGYSMRRFVSPIHTHNVHCHGYL